MHGIASRVAVVYGLRTTTFQATLLLAHSVTVTYLNGALQDADGLSESGPLPDIMEDITVGVEVVGAGIVDNLAAAAGPVLGTLFE
jgi:hypothetical protein